MGIVLSVASYFLSSAQPAVKTNEKSEMSDKFAKLPTYAHPTHYSIHLKPNLTTFKCEGRETIAVKIDEPTNKLQLHSDNIEVKSAKVKLADGKELLNLPIQLDKKWGWLQVDLPSEINPQQVELTLDFIAEHSEHLQGFYRSSYKDAQGNSKFMVSTQFESTYARKAFPCWDEPTYKATFDIELEVDKDLVALSNTPIVSETEAEGKKIYKYETTPIMSSYLIAFAVGEFEYIEAKAKTGTLVRLYTCPGKKEQGRFALDVACRALEYYTEWFAQPYPIPKCDLIAIPDFSMGAMENWGLVTYREVCLLVDEAKSSHRQKSFVALIVSHELAHFWFGDLVTMKWWTDLWLKEGFASFMEYLFVSRNNPEFKIWLQFVSDEVARGFDLDSLRSSHAIEVEIDNPNELDEIYDSITYAKSNSINRMLFNYLGEERFRNGLRVYLERFKYSNAVTKDLWKALSEASGEDVDQMMSTWTKQVGFPVVQVSEERLPGNKRKILLKQQRFLADGSTDDTLWHVPIGICTASNPNEPVHKVLLTKAQDEFVLDGVDEKDWIKLNASTTGFFQVQYSKDMLTSLLAAIKDQKLGVLDRFGISNDLFAQVKAGKVPTAQFLALYAASTNENEYIVWGALDTGLSTISNALARASDPSLKEKLNEFVRRALEPVGERLGWEKRDGEGRDFCSTAHAKKAFDADQLKVLDRPIRQTVEGILINKKIREESEKSVAQFLIQN
uniref:Aminopeptidase n=1 Tax=Bursaphelenchus xylophilus TaxID=6326 RepID=A0A1I7SBU0_BURXY